MLECEYFVRLGQRRMEESDDCAFKLGVLLCLDRDRREAFPQDNLTNVRRNEQTDTISETVTFLEELVKQLDNETGDSQLKKDSDCVEDAELVDFTVHA